MKPGIGLAGTDESHTGAVPPPVLKLSMLLADAGSVPAADRELAADIVEMLDVIDDDTATSTFLLDEWVPGVAATIRAILGPHHPDSDGRCAGCPPSAAGWPCPPWRTAYRWMFELDPGTGDRRDIAGYYVVTRRDA